MNAKSLGDRLAERRNELDWTQEDLAKRTGLTRMGISKIELGLTQNARADTLFTLADALKVNARWLLYGHGEKKANSNITNTEYPLITWTEVDSYISGTWLPNSKKDIEHYLCPIPCGKKTFVLEIENDSMLPRFELTDLIFVDPEVKQPENNKYYIFKNISTDSLNLKQLQLIDNVAFLRSLNPDYPQELRFTKLDEKSVIIGTVVSHLKQLR